MTWFFAFLIVALMGVVAVVASGRGGWMADAYDDRPDSRVQADGPLTATDLRQVRFSTAFRGYRMSEVDALLDRLAEELSPPVQEAEESSETYANGETPADDHSDAPRQDADLDAELDSELDSELDAQAEDSRS